MPTPIVKLNQAKSGGYSIRRPWHSVDTSLLHSQSHIYITPVDPCPQLAEKSDLPTLISSSQYVRSSLHSGADLGQSAVAYVHQVTVLPPDEEGGLWGRFVPFLSRELGSLFTCSGVGMPNRLVRQQNKGTSILPEVLKSLRC